MIKTPSQVVHENIKKEFFQLLIRKDNVSKKEWLDFEKKLATNKNNNLSVFNLYLVFKSKFDSTPYIKPLTKNEINSIRTKLAYNGVHSIVDYKILGNITSLVPFSLVEELYSYLFPIQLASTRNNEFNQVIVQTYNNIITYTIKQEMVSKTNYYLEQINKIDFGNSGYVHKLRIKYLEQLSLYSQTGNPKYNSKAFHFANISKELDDLATYESLVTELEQYSNKTNHSSADVKTILFDDKIIDSK